MLQIGDRVSLKNCPNLTGIIYGMAVDVGDRVYDVAWDFSISTSHPQEGLQVSIYATMLVYVGPSTLEERLTHRHEAVRGLANVNSG